jgi:hypothetical protein
MQPTLRQVPPRLGLPLVPFEVVDANGFEAELRGADRGGVAAGAGADHGYVVSCWAFLQGLRAYYGPRTRARDKLGRWRQRKWTLICATLCGGHWRTAACWVISPQTTVDP